MQQAFSGVLAAARGGEAWAWRHIYAGLVPALLGYLRARGPSEPEDLLGEVLLQLVRDLPSFDGGESDLRAWAFTIAHHRLLDERRRRTRRPSDSSAPEELERLGPLGDVEDEALAGLGTERVARLLAGLSPDQRNVILLRVLGDLTTGHVARAIGKTPGAVKALQRRGLEALGDR